jgi:hypothetical protein
MKRKNVTVFSISFIDCICCGLGAMILLFVVVNSQNAAQRQRVTEDLSSETNRWEQESSGTARPRASPQHLDEISAELAKTEGFAENPGVSPKDASNYRPRQQTLASREHQQAQGRLKSLRRREALQAGAKRERNWAEPATFRPGDRQYLTGLKMGGQRILILVDASASMLDDTVVGVIRRRNQGTAEKLRAPKWRQAVATVDWLTANLPPTSRVQVYVFNESAAPLLEGTQGTWLEAGDIDRLNQAVDKLRRLPPEKGTSLINAFEAAGKMSPAPDNIFLLTDGLPTMGRDKPWGNRVSADKRLSLSARA